jgi:hypothetical protein
VNNQNETLITKTGCHEQNLQLNNEMGEESILISRIFVGLVEDNKEPAETQQKMGTRWQQTE